MTNASYISPGIYQDVWSRRWWEYNLGGIPKSFEYCPTTWKTVSIDSLLNLGFTFLLVSLPFHLCSKNEFQTFDNLPFPKCTKVLPKVTKRRAESPFWSSIVGISQIRIAKAIIQKVYVTVIYQNGDRLGNFKAIRCESANVWNSLSLPAPNKTIPLINRLIKSQVIVNPEL